jgi:hypothetical protein
MLAGATMPGADGIAVRPADLDAHATHVDAVAGELATAKDAGATVRLDTQAYGKLCVMVPVMIDGLQGVVLDAVQAAVDSLHDTADRLRSAADGYRASDGL